MTSIGTTPTCDFQVSSENSGVLFTLIQKENAYELMLGVELTLNGQTLRKNVVLGSSDRIEWSRGAAVFLSLDLSAVSAETAAAKQSMELLLNLTSALQSPGSVVLALETSSRRNRRDGRRGGYLLSEYGGAGWQMTTSQKPSSRKAIFSNTILQEALKRRETVYVENMIGHPWSEAHSVLQAEFFPRPASRSSFKIVCLARVRLPDFAFPGSVDQERGARGSFDFGDSCRLLMGMSTQLQSTQLETPAFVFHKTRLLS